MATKRSVFRIAFRIFKWSVLAAYLGLVWAYFSTKGPLTFPVYGVSSTLTASTFGAPRPGGRKHQGADIFARRGAAVQSVGWGFVVFAGQDPLGGNVIRVVGEGGLYTYYAHLDSFAKKVAPGYLVSKGEEIGTVGDTGNAKGTSPHLHFETRPLAFFLFPVDPVRLFKGEHPIPGVGKLEMPDPLRLQEKELPQF